jgi:hypothetical protein
MLPINISYYSALDAESEKQVQSAINNVAKGN